MVHLCIRNGQTESVCVARSQQVKTPQPVTSGVSRPPFSSWYPGHSSSKELSKETMNFGGRGPEN